jgi:hypothetical protein
MLQSCGAPSETGSSVSTGTEQVTGETNKDLEVVTVFNNLNPRSGDIVVTHYNSIGDGRVYVSSDKGESWENYILPFSNPKGIVYEPVNQKYIIIGGANIATSDDLITWELYSGDLSFEHFFDIDLLDNGTVVAVGNGNYVAMSHDGGISWEKIDAPVGNNRNISYSSDTGMFNVTRDNYGVYFSEDLTNWTLSPISTPTHFITGGEYGNGAYVVLSGDRAESYRSTDNGTSWTTHSITGATGYHSVHFVNNQFIIVGGPPYQFGREIFTSVDGSSWNKTQVSCTKGCFGTSVVYSDGYYYITGAGVIHKTADIDNASAYEEILTLPYGHSPDQIANRIYAIP